MPKAINLACLPSEIVVGYCGLSRCFILRGLRTCSRERQMKITLSDHDEGQFGIAPDAEINHVGIDESWGLFCPFGGVLGCGWTSNPRPRVAWAPRFGNARKCSSKELVRP